MVEAVISIRPTRLGDENEIAAVHDAAWREAYRGLIPGRELEQMIARKGPAFWRLAILNRAPILVLESGKSIVGYVRYGPNRAPVLGYVGEIFELCVAPERQGCGLGRRMFEAARKDLALHRLTNLAVWALADDERAIQFCRRLGGQVVCRARETFGDQERDRVAFSFS